MIDILRYIHSINRRQLSFKLDVNHFTDLTEDEFKNHKGTLYDDENATSDYEKRIPIFNENFDPGKTDANQRGEFGNNGKENGDEMLDSDKKENTTMVENETGNGEIKSGNETSFKNQSYENDGTKSDKFSKKNYTDDKNRKNDQMNIEKNYETNELRKKSEIATMTSFEMEMKELKTLGVELDELSQQLDGKRSINNNITKSVDNEEGVYHKESGNYSNYGAGMKKNERSMGKVNKTIDVKYGGIMSEVGERHSVIMKETKYGINKNLNQDSYSKLSFVSNAVGRNDKKIADFNAALKAIEKKALNKKYSKEKSKGKMQARMRKKQGKKRFWKHKKIRKNSNPTEDFNFDIKTFEPIDSNEINSLFNADIENKLNSKEFANFYQPEVEVRKIPNNEIELKDGLLEFYKNDARRRTIMKNNSDFEDFLQNWKEPKNGNVNPFYMFGADENNQYLNENDTIEYDFVVKDNYRFPDEFQLKANRAKSRKNNGRISKRKKHAKRKTKIPKVLDWRDYGKKFKQSYLSYSLILMLICSSFFLSSSFILFFSFCRSFVQGFFLTSVSLH